MEIKNQSSCFEYTPHTVPTASSSSPSLTMAAAHCATAATTSFHFPSSRKPPLTLSSIPTQFPSKPIKRKTHFHTKVFNTLPKPELTPTIPSDSPLPQQFAGSEAKESLPIEQQLPVSESESPSGQYPIDQSPIEGLNGFEPIEAKQHSEQFSGKKTIKFPLIEQKRRIDIYRFLREKIEECGGETNEFSYSESTSSPPPLGFRDEFAGNNNFASPSILQLGLSFVAAIALDVAWSISMNNHLKRMKAKEEKLGTEKDERKNKSIWERWAEHKRKRVEAKNKGDVVVDESKVVEIQELAKEAREEEKSGAKGNDSNADDHVVESQVKKEG